MSLGMEFNWTRLMLHVIIVEKLVQEKHLSFDLLSKIRQVKKKGGSLRFLTGRTQRGGGGGSLRIDTGDVRPLW